MKALHWRNFWPSVYDLVSGFKQAFCNKPEGRELDS
jgi:hypothetical protein